MRQRQYIPTVRRTADRMHVSSLNSIQLSLFGHISSTGMLYLSQTGAAHGHPLPSDTQSVSPNIILPGSGLESVLNSRNNRISADLFTSKTVSERIRDNVKAIQFARQLAGERYHRREKFIGAVFGMVWTPVFEERSRYGFGIDQALTIE